MWSGGGIWIIDLMLCVLQPSVRGVFIAIMKLSPRRGLLRTMALFFGQRNGFVSQRKTQKLELRTKHSIQHNIILSVGEPPTGAKLWRRTHQQGKQEEEDPLQGEEEAGHHWGNEVVRSHQQVQENTTFFTDRLEHNKRFFFACL